MREVVQDPNDEMEADLVRVANTHLQVLDDHRHRRAQRRIGIAPVKVPPEENRGESRDDEIVA